MVSAISEPSFVIGMFPSARSVDEPGGLEEERRLCYVAITRAKKDLHITSARNRLLYGRPMDCAVSRFLKEIPDECLEKTAVAPPPVFQRPRKTLADRHILKDAVTSTPRRPTAPAHKVNYTVGMKVRHSTFGEGTVVAVVPMATDSMLTVSFAAVGEKKLMANFAKMQIL